MPEALIKLVPIQRHLQDWGQFCEADKLFRILLPKRRLLGFVLILAGHALGGHVLLKALLYRRIAFDIQRDHGKLFCARRLKVCVNAPDD